MTQASRKRGRGEMEEESSDFMPLSKRINNLHINNLTGLAEKSSLPESIEATWGIPGNNNFIPSPNHSEPSQGSSSSCDGYSNSNFNYPAEYMPDLNASENPFYYENNKLLYNLHMERMQRLNEQF